MKSIVRIFPIISALLIAISLPLLCLTGCKQFKEAPISALGKEQYPDEALASSVKYDVLSYMEQQTNSVDKALALLKYATFNMLNVDRYYFEAESYSESNTYDMRSQYVYVRQGTDFLKQISSYTSYSSVKITNSAIRRVRCGNHLLVEESSSVKYKSDKILVAWPNKLSKNENTEIGAVEEINAELYSRFNATINFDDRNQVQSADISIKKDADGNSYYVLQIICNTDALNQSKYTLENLAKSIPLATESQYTEYKLTFEIWDCGLFKSASYAEKWSGKIYVLNTNAEISQDYSFSYNEKDCSISEVLKSIGYDKYLTPEEVAQLFGQNKA